MSSLQFAARGAVSTVRERSSGRVRRALYIVAGWTAVSLGVIGIFVPLWPSTCFLLSAGWFFARSSPRAERWLHENRLFGRHLKEYRDHGVVSPRVRAGSLATLWACIGLSAYLLRDRPVAVTILFVVATTVTLHLRSLPTRPGHGADPDRRRRRDRPYVGVGDPGASRP